MATKKTRVRKSVSQPGAVHSWTIYEFYITSKEYALGGSIEMPPACTVEETTRAIMHLFAQSAHELHIEIDPFNAQITIKKLT